MPDPQPGDPPAVPGDRGPGDGRPEPTRLDDPASAPAAPRWRGSAAVPPAGERPRRHGRFADATSADPAGADPAAAGSTAPPRDPTSEYPTGEAEAWLHRPPVDPWADADPGPPLAPLPLSPPAPAPPPPVAPPRPPEPAAVPPTRLDPALAPAAPDAPAGRPPPPPPGLPAPPPGSPAQPPGLPAPGHPPVPVRRPRGRRRDRRRPVAPPPGWQPPAGWVPVAVRRRRRWPWVLMLLGALTVACCCGCPAWFGWPMARQYPATAAVPAELADLQLRDDAAGRRVVDRLRADVRAAHLLAEDTFAGVYTDGHGKRVVIFGTTGFRFSPQRDLDAELDRLTDRYALTGLATVDSGEIGAHQQCGTGRDGAAAVVVCGWADHGSLGTGVFTRRDIDDSAELLRLIRTTVITRD